MRATPDWREGVVKTPKSDYEVSLLCYVEIWIRVHYLVVKCQYKFTFMQTTNNFKDESRLKSQNFVYIEYTPKSIECLNMITV